MEIHWRNPLALTEKDRDSAERRIGRLAEPRRDVIDVWVDIADDHHHRQGRHRVTLRAQVRRGEIIAHGEDFETHVALRQALDSFAHQLRDLRARRAEKLPRGSGQLERSQAPSE